MTEAPVADGLARTLDEMARGDVDVLLLGREGNARFVSGANRLWLAGTRPFAPGCVVVRDSGAVHLLNITDAGVPPEIPRENLYPISWNPMTIVGNVTAIPGVGAARRVGVDGLSPLFEQLLGAVLPDAELVDGESLLRTARRLKTPQEVEAIRAAITVAEQALGAAVDALRPGVQERELLGVFEQEMARAGVTTPAYEGAFCIVTDEGPPRHWVSDCVVEEGDLVAMNVGVLRHGWEGSLARTWPCAAPTAEHRRRWAVWWATWSRLIERCRPGVLAAEARSVAGAQLHGVGLGYEGLADDTVLEPGMVLGVELVAAGVVGKETVLITDDDFDLLTTFPHSTRGERD